MTLKSILGLRDYDIELRSCDHNTKVKLRDYGITIIFFLKC